MWLINCSWLVKIFRSWVSYIRTVCFPVPMSLCILFLAICVYYSFSALRIIFHMWVTYSTCLCFLVCLVRGFVVLFFRYIAALLQSFFLCPAVEYVIGGFFYRFVVVPVSLVGSIYIVLVLFSQVCAY